MGVERDNLMTTQTDGFIIDTIVWDKKLGTIAGRTAMDRAAPFLWKGWEIAPPYKERLKESYFMIQEAWKKSSTTGSGIK